MKGIFAILIGIVLAAAPMFAAIHILGSPPSAGNDDCGEKGDHDGDHENEDDCDDDEDDDDCDEDDDSVGIGPANGDDDDDDDCDDDEDEDDDGGAAGGAGRLISESALLNGLEGGALFPFIDTTPNNITRAHIAITDSTETCAPDAGPPQNIQVLVGVAGVSLVNVMTSATNTGIGDSNQCVFHVTIVPGEGGVPAQVTDIVIWNAGEAPLSGFNTATATAEVA